MKWDTSSLVGNNRLRRRKAGKPPEERDHSNLREHDTAIDDYAWHTGTILNDNIRRPRFKLDLILSLSMAPHYDSSILSQPTI